MIQVPLVSNIGTTGLGLNVLDVPVMDYETETKRLKWKKAQERYNQTITTNKHHDQ